MEKGKLVDLIGKNLDGYTFGYCHAISIDKNGLLPATVAVSGVKIICVEEALVADILARLPERTHHVEQSFCLCNEAKGDVYRLASSEADDTKCETYIDRATFDKIVAVDPNPFQWPST
jgi:hypothetical protein